jgi:hypothetical protein
MFCLETDRSRQERLVSSGFVNRTISKALRLAIRNYETSDGEKREAVEVVANDVQFLGAKNGAGSAAAAAPEEEAF